MDHATPRENPTILWEYLAGAFPRCQGNRDVRANSNGAIMTRRVMERNNPMAHVFGDIGQIRVGYLLQNFVKAVRVVHVAASGGKPCRAGQEGAAG